MRFRILLAVLVACFLSLAGVAQATTTELHLHVTATTQNSVTIDWDDYTEPGNALRRYNIKYRDNANDSTVDSISWYTRDSNGFVTGPGPSQYTFTGLTAGQLRDVEVQPVMEPDGGTRFPTPWLTIQAACNSTVSAGGNIQTAVNAATTGQVVCVHGGTYSQSLAVNKAVTLVNVASETPIIDATGMALGHSNAPVNLSSAAVLDGFEVRNSAGRGINVNDGNGTIIRNAKIHDIQGQSIYLSGDNLTVADSAVYHAALSNQGGTPTWGFWPGGIGTWVKSSGARSTNISLLRNSVTDVWGEGIVAVHANNVTIDHNTSKDNWSMDVYLDNTAHDTVTWNQLGSTSSLHDRNGGGAIGVGIAVEDYSGYGFTPSSADDLTITDNTVDRVLYGVNYWQASTQPGTTYSNVKVRRNTITNSVNAGISFADVPSGITQPFGNEATSNSVSKGITLGDPGAWTLTSNTTLP